MTDDDPRYSGAARAAFRTAYRRRMEALAAAPLGGPHPAPIIPLRDVASADEMPAGGARLAREATAHGWRGRATYAKGTQMYANGKPGGIVESVACRMERGGPGVMEHAVALWYRHAAGDSAGKWVTEGAWYWVDGQIPRNLGVTSIRNMVKSDHKTTDGLAANLLPNRARA
jgi:hypothetical protein